MFMLPRFDRRLVQHPPHSAAADLFAQRRLGATHQVSKRLPAQGLFRLCDHLARHRLDQRLIQRGKKRACARVRLGLRWRNHRQPSDFAIAALAERTNPPPWPPRRFSCRAAREAATQAEIAARLGQPRFGAGQCPEPLARNRWGKYKERGLVLA